MDISCGICAADHGTNNCSMIEIKCHIYDTVVPSRARLSLPDFLELDKMADGTSMVITKCFVSKGTKFGPFVAKRLLTLKPNTPFPIKLFVDDSEDFSEYYLDTVNEHDCNWMMFVTPAETVEEQNLICYQDNQDIYYVSLRDISIGERLKVWYSAPYATRMKAEPLTTKHVLEEEKILNSAELSKLITKQQNIMQRDNWSCKFCGTVESNVVNFSTHILEHYVLQLRKVCEICRAAFATRKGLKKHLKVVHCNSLGNPPDQKATTNAKENEIVIERTRRKDDIGGPLLNDILADSLDNSNIMLQQTVINAFDMENQNMLIESDNLSVDNILNENVKQLEHFNFEIDETEERFVCDVCLKAFNKLKLLVQHLQKHTARYVCYKCLKVFCRNENLKSHICNNTNRFECAICKKLFTQKKYLTKHVEAKHTNKITCNSCCKSFTTDEEKSEHNCVATIEKQAFPCITCSKVFYKECYLRKHMRVHLPLLVKAKTMRYICEVCGKKFSDGSTLKQHTATHREPTFECHVCGKKFGRRQVLNNHVLTHSVPQFKCEKCGKYFKVKNNLKMHQRLHNSTETYKCLECPRIFNNKSNMLKHKKSVHNKICTVCGKKFPSSELRAAHAIEHFKSYYACEFCNKVVKLRSSLMRHLKKKHEQDIVNMDLSKIKAVTKEKSEGSENDGALLEDVKTEEHILSLNDLDMDFEMQQSVGDQEMCLLSNNDHVLTLGPNTYMVQNKGTTVTGDLNKVVLYVFDQFSKV